MIGRRKPRLSRVVCFMAVIFALAFMATPSPATKNSEEVLDVGTITVMAPQPGVKITAEKTIINPEEFKKPKEARNVIDILTEIGGVDIQQINPLMASPGDEVSIRGLNEGRMVIEIDGRRINHTGHLGRYIVDWSTLNIDDVERIEIIRGGHSVLHPFAIGGVINIVTKKGKKTDVAKPELKVKTGYGAFNTTHFLGSINGGVENFIGYHLAASKQETDGYLRNNFQKTDNLSGHLTFYLPHEVTLSLGGKFSEVDYGYPVLNDPTRPDYDSDYPDFVLDADQLRHVPPVGQVAGPPVPYWDRQTTYLDGILNLPLGPGIFKLHCFRTIGKRWNHYYRGKFIEDLSQDETRGVIGEYRDFTLFNSHRLVLGTEYQELGSPPTNQRIYIVTSAYLQDTISLGDRVVITPGVRYYHIDKDIYYPWFESGGDKPAFPKTGKQETSEDWFPSLKLDFQATPDTAVYAAVSRSHRLPCP